MSLAAAKILVLVCVTFSTFEIGEPSPIQGNLVPRSSSQVKLVGCGLDDLMKLFPKLEDLLPGMFGGASGASTAEIEPEAEAIDETDGDKEEAVNGSGEVKVETADDSVAAGDARVSQSGHHGDGVGGLQSAHYAGSSGSGNQGGGISGSTSGGGAVAQGGGYSVPSGAANQGSGYGNSGTGVQGSTYGTSGGGNYQSTGYGTSGSTYSTSGQGINYQDNYVGSKSLSNGPPKPKSRIQ